MPNQTEILSSAKPVKFQTVQALPFYFSSNGSHHQRKVDHEHRWVPFPCLHYFCTVFIYKLKSCVICLWWRDFYEAKKIYIKQASLVSLGVKDTKSCKSCKSCHKHDNSTNKLLDLTPSIAFSVIVISCRMRWLIHSKSVDYTVRYIICYHFWGLVCLFSRSIDEIWRHHRCCPPHPTLPHKR
jgi:hypothetical protein